MEKTKGYDLVFQLKSRGFDHSQTSAVKTPGGHEIFLKGAFTVECAFKFAA